MHTKCQQLICPGHRRCKSLDCAASPAAEVDEDTGDGSRYLLAIVLLRVLLLVCSHMQRHSLLFKLLFSHLLMRQNLVLGWLLNVEL